MKHLGLAASEQHKLMHQHLHFTPEQLSSMTDDQVQHAHDVWVSLAGIEWCLEQPHSRQVAPWVICNSCLSWAFRQG